MSRSTMGTCVSYMCGCERSSGTVATVAAAIAALQEHRERDGCTAHLGTRTRPGVNAYVARPTPPAAPPRTPPVRGKGAPVTSAAAKALARGGRVRVTRR